MHFALIVPFLLACSTPSSPPAPKVEAPAAATAAVATAPDPAGYTCPMHPSVHEAVPGKCPICGMNLVPATAAPLPEHDHRTLHGGQVSMFGDHHVEYVGTAGEYRFWVTNATREPITSGLSGSVNDNGKTIPLAADNATGLLSAPGEGAGTRPVLVEVSADGRAFSLGFTAVPAEEPAHGHDHEAQ